MIYQLKQQKGEAINLAFNNFFLSRYAKLVGADLGAAVSTLEMVAGEDFDKRVAIVCAGIEAYRRMQGDYTPVSNTDAETIINNIAGGIVGYVNAWNELFEVLIKALFPEDLGKAAAPQKKAGAKSRK